jgi:hypothetical protein
VVSRHHRALQIVSVVGIANFLLFVAIAGAIGGDALNGTGAGGRYYLDSHGQKTEVSRAVFVYSQVHAVSAFAGIILSMVAEVAYRATGGPHTPDRPRKRDSGPWGKEGR